MEITAPLDPAQLQQAILLWQLIGIVGVLLGGAVAAVNIWDKLRRKPAIDETFARRAELIDVEDRMVKAIERLEERLSTQIDGVDKQAVPKIYDRIQQLETTLQNVLRDLTHSLGRMEGADSVIRSFRDALKELVAEKREHA